MFKRYWLIFLLLLYSLPVFAGEDYVLERIVVSKPPTHRANNELQNQDIQNSTAESIAEVIGLLGIDTQGRSLNYGVQTDYLFRGLSYEGLVILVDGQRVNDPQTGHHNSDIPLTLEDVDSISLDSLRGELNIVTKKAETLKNVLEISYGQHQTRSTRASFSRRKENAGVKFSLERNESAGFSTGTDFRTLSVTVLSDFEFSPEREAFLSLGYNEKEFGAYDFYTPGRNYPSQEWTKTFSLNTGLKLGLNGFLLSPSFRWRVHTDKFMLDRNQERSTYLNHHRTDIYSGDLSIQFPESDFGNFCLQLGHEHEMIDSARLGNHSRAHESVSFKMQKVLGDYFTVDNVLTFDYFDTFKDKISTSIVLSYMLGLKQRMHLGFASSIRRPTFTELYYQDPITVGNSTLSPEELFTYQLGYEAKNQDSSFGLTMFFRQENKLINWVKRIPGDDWQAENMLEADCIGVELYLQKRFNSKLNAGLNYSYIYKSLKESSWLYKYGPSYARHLLNSFLEFDLSLFSSVIELQYKQRPARRGWVLVNLSVSRDVNLAGNESKIFAQVNNLFNAGYQDIEGIASSGRWVRAGVRIEW